MSYFEPGLRIIPFKQLPSGIRQWPKGTLANTSGAILESRVADYITPEELRRLFDYMPVLYLRATKLVCLQKPVV